MRPTAAVARKDAHPLTAVSVQRFSPALMPSYPLLPPSQYILSRDYCGRSEFLFRPLQEARSEATATPAGSVYEMEHANGRHPAAAEGRPSLASADSGGGGAPRTHRGPERGMLKSPSSGSLSALARGGKNALRSCAQSAGGWTSDVSWRLPVRLRWAPAVEHGAVILT